MFKWDNRYLIGINTIDDQHKIMFEIGNRLSGMTISKMKEDRFIDILVLVNELLIYSTDHFKDEEKYMRTINYPDLKNHIIGHNKFLDYVSSIDILNLDANQESVVTDLLEFISNWISNHILISDQKIVEHLENKSFKKQSQNTINK